MNQIKVRNKEIFLENDTVIISKTDTKGNISYCNEIFIEISGYTEQELLQQPHKILRHPDMPKVIFKLLWEAIRAGEEINAYVKNRTKNGSFYWVLANVTPSFDTHNNIIGYFSVRRKPTQEALKKIENLYTKLLGIEKSKGLDNSLKYLNNLLDEKGASYAEFILSC